MSDILRSNEEGTDEWVPVRGIRLHVRRWEGDGIPFVLLHGLASNARTWYQVGRILSDAGHPVAAVDQRGHGLSDKPASGYGFDEVTADLRELVDALAFPAAPVLAGQSWGGNVVLDFAARFPGIARSLVLVDGGFLELSARPGATWETVARELKPPDLSGKHRDELAYLIRKENPDWSDEGIEATLGNFETLPDGTIKPWLSLDRHMEILRALWEHHPPRLYDRVREPVLILPADTGDPGWTERTRATVRAAEAGLARSKVEWFDRTSHNIHVHRPEKLAQVILESLREGFL